VKTRTLLLVLTAGAVLAVWLASAALAGGWAVSTLDPLPPPRSGEPIDVGFSIRQHGVHLVAPEGLVAIAVTTSEGVTTVFPARAQELPGRFVATVTFPVAGTYRWEVRQGWFPSQDLGPITVAAPAAPAMDGPASDATVASGPRYRGPVALRVLFPAAAAGCAGLGVADLVRRRRARPVVA
jgi:hypothetical protein